MNTPKPAAFVRIGKEMVRWSRAFHPHLNRWTNKPHEHKREITRTLRRAKRLHMNYMLNGGFSRRGNEGAGL